MYGAGLGPDETPHVEQTVDGEEYMVDVNLTPAADILLQALAAALSRPGCLRRVVGPHGINRPTVRVGTPRSGSSWGTGRCGRPSRSA
jgi:hypothetical protein